MRLEEGQRIQRSSIISELGFPELVDFLLGELLESFFGRGRFKKLKWVRQLVLLADILDLDEPGLGAIRTCNEEMSGNFIKDVIFKSTNHTKMSKLSKVEEAAEG